MIRSKRFWKRPPELQEVLREKNTTKTRAKDGTRRGRPYLTFRRRRYDDFPVVSVRIPLEMAACVRENLEWLQVFHWQLFQAAWDWWKARGYTARRIQIHMGLQHRDHGEFDTMSPRIPPVLHREFTRQAKSSGVPQWKLYMQVLLGFLDCYGGPRNPKPKAHAN